MTKIIVFDNWTEGDTSNCRYIVVRGYIMENETVVTSEAEAIAVTNGQSTGKWPVYAGHFKAIVELTRGANDILFAYKRLNASLNVSFVVHETDLCVVPVYVVCNGDDGRFQAPEEVDNSVKSACLRIALGAFLAQCLFAEKLRERGFPRKSFQVENDLDQDSPTCQVFRSQLDCDEARQLDQEALWERIGREIMTSDLGSDNRKYLAILSCTYWDGSKVVGDPALGGGGLALLGSGTLHTWPTDLSDVVRCFTDYRKIPPNLYDNSCYRGTYAGCLSTSLGAVCHEMGHMFNLGHTPTGIMSRGFDNIERVFLSVPTPEAKGRAKGDEMNDLILVPCLSVTSGSSANCREYNRILSTTPKDDDLTSLTSACAAILAHHEWFNENPNDSSPITYDPLRSIVSSEAGLKVVQLRGPCGSVLRSWELGRKSLHKHFILPRLNVSPTTLVAINTCGFLLTEQV